MLSFMANIIKKFSSSATFPCIVKYTVPEEAALLPSGYESSATLCRPDIS
jgi:hypothetical protein